MRFCILLALVALSFAERFRYDRYQVWEVTVNGEADAEFLTKLQSDKLVDIGSSIKRGKQPVEIMVAPKHVRALATKFLKRGMPFEVITDNFQEYLDNEWKRLDAKHKGPEAYVYDPNDFNTLDDNYNHLLDLMSSCSGGLSCESSNSGVSYEGRPVYTFKVGVGSNKPVVWIDATLHAREWLSTTTAVRFLDYLVNEYGSNSEVTDLLNVYEFWITPIGNPDGYAYSWTNQRLWRKNRKPNGGCVGTDLNRNFDYLWGLQGVSHDPCQETYCGTSGGSESETQAFQNAIASCASRMTTLITLHSYGYMWMHPWGNTLDFTSSTPCQRAPEHADMFAGAQAAANGIFSVSNRRWDYGTSCEVIYATTGATDDYSKGAHGVKYPYNPELRGNSFIIDKSNITPSFNEVWRGTVELIRQIEAIEGVGYPVNK